MEREGERGGEKERGQEGEREKGRRGGEKRIIIRHELMRLVKAGKFKIHQTGHRLKTQGRIDVASEVQV